MGRLRITEIFLSLQGEAGSQGYPTVFVRLTGCPLRCTYCDTEYAFKGGRWMSLERIQENVREYATPRVTVTGGEPLGQADCPELLRRLCDRGYQVSLETSGALDVSGVDPRVCKVMDIKTPGSGEQDRNLRDNIAHLRAPDQVKFVIADRRDYQWAKEQLELHRLPDRCEILFSPCQGRQDATELADWVLEDRLPVRFQIQLHKFLWGNAPGK